MGKNKLRRKTFLVTIGATVLGWMGARAAEPRQKREKAPEVKPGKDLIREEPRAVPSATRFL